MMPAKIYICGVLFSISIFNLDEFGFALGYANIAESWIKLNEELSEYMRRQTLLHEIIHAVDGLLLDGRAEHELKRTMGKVPENEKMFRLEEPTVVAFSQGLWATLADPRNAEVVQWMFQ